LPIDKWHDVIGEPTFADAILDRIVHNAYRLELDGPPQRSLRRTRECSKISDPASARGLVRRAVLQISDRGLCRRSVMRRVAHRG